MSKASAMFLQAELRKMWFDTAKQCSVGILLHGFDSEAFDYPQTLGNIIRQHPVVRSRFTRWLKRGGLGVMQRDEMAYMLRPAREKR